MPSNRAWKGRLFRWWRKIKTETGPAAIECALELNINRANGRVSLELLLVNHVVLAGLDTSWQTSIPPGQAKREVRHSVRAYESLEVELCPSHL
jgi:hypothetical protein